MLTGRRLKHLVLVVRIGRDDGHTSGHAILVAGIKRVRLSRVRGVYTTNSSVLAASRVDSVIRAPLDLLAKLWSDARSKRLDVTAVTQEVVLSVLHVQVGVLVRVQRHRLHHTDGALDPPLVVATVRRTHSITVLRLPMGVLKVFTHRCCHTCSLLF